MRSTPRSASGRSRTIVGLAAALVYVLGGGSALAHVVNPNGASSAPDDAAYWNPTDADSQVLVTIRINGSAHVVDVSCIPRSGISPGVVDASPDDALIDFHALCDNSPPTQFYER